MRTRVVRYWATTDWLYAIQKYEQMTTDEQLYTFAGGVAVPSNKSRKAGDWYWAHELGALSREKAMEIAQCLAETRSYDVADVVAEYGTDTPSGSALTERSGGGDEC